MNLFNRYASRSGQVVNTSKSRIYARAISQQRFVDLAPLLGYSVGSLPFIYLGIPIFKGKPKSTFLQPTTDRIKNKLST